MIYGRTLLRPAAAEVRQMLNRIKMDNMERGRSILAAKSVPDVSYEEGNSHRQHQQTAPWRFNSFRNFEMGSFTSTPKVQSSNSGSALSASDDDDRAEDGDGDVVYPARDAFAASPAAFAARLGKEQLRALPPPIARQWKRVANVGKDNMGNGMVKKRGERVRVMQWNVLSQALGTKNDNFVRCPPSALDWETRRFRMMEEIARHEADVVCLQEVDHFRFLSRMLSGLGYSGHFFPKPDSPCLYLPGNTGPDGCAIFFRRDKFDLREVRQRVIQVWNVESNQVVLQSRLRSRSTGKDLIVATTHLKARCGALLSTLRNEQGKDLLAFLRDGREAASPNLVEGGRRRATPVIVTGDFNAEPSEPVYETLTENNTLGLRSAYRDPSTGLEPAYTTWKVREDGEHVETLDYIFHSGGDGSAEVEAVLDFPTAEAIGAARLPSHSYASDHLSLVADFRIQ